MNIWKWFGWDNKDARNDRARNFNIHSTIQWVAICIAIVLVARACAQ